MNKKIITYFPNIVVFFLAFLIIVFSEKDMPLFPDGRAYTLMAENLFAAKGVVSLVFLQRLLPTTIVGFLSHAFVITIPRSFFYAAAGVFILLTCLLYNFLKKEIEETYISISLSMLLLIAFWPITYNLRNAYQLCDLMAYLCSLGMLITFRSKHFFIFMALALLSIFIRQNLWVLALSGGFYLLLQSYFDEGVRKVLKIQTFTLGFSIAVIAYAMFGIEGSAVKSYFNGSQYIEHFDYKLYVLGIFKMTSPFWLIFIFRGKRLVKDIVNYFPFVLYCFFSMAIPFNFILKAPNEDFTFVERVGYQGLWPLLILATIFFGKKLKLLLGKLAPFSMLLIFFYGTAHLALTVNFLPLFILPSAFRYFFVPIVIFLALSLKLKNSSIINN